MTRKKDLEKPVSAEEDVSIDAGDGRDPSDMINDDPFFMQERPELSQVMLETGIKTDLSQPRPEYDHNPEEASEEGLVPASFGVIIDPPSDKPIDYAPREKSEMNYGVGDPFETISKTISAVNRQEAGPAAIADLAAAVQRQNNELPPPDDPAIKELLASYHQHGRQTHQHSSPPLLLTERHHPAPDAKPSETVQETGLWDISDLDEDGDFIAGATPVAAAALEDTAEEIAARKRNQMMDQNPAGYASDILSDYRVTEEGFCIMPITIDLDRQPDHALMEDLAYRVEDESLTVTVRYTREGMRVRLSMMVRDTHIGSIFATLYKEGYRIG